MNTGLFWIILLDLGRKMVFADLSNDVLKISFSDEHSFCKCTIKFKIGFCFHISFSEVYIGPTYTALIVVQI